MVEELTNAEIANNDDGHMNVKCFLIIRWKRCLLMKT